MKLVEKVTAEIYPSIWDDRSKERPEEQKKGSDTFSLCGSRGSFVNFRFCVNHSEVIPVAVQGSGGQERRGT